MATTIPDSSYGGKSSGQAGGKTYTPPTLQQSITNTVNPGGVAYNPQLAGAFQNLYGQIAPFLPGAQSSIANAQQGVGNAINQFGTIQAGNQYQAGLLNQQNDIAQQQLALQQQQQGINQGALNRQQQLLPQQNALQQQLFGITNQGFGLSGQQLDLQQQALDQAQSTAYRQYGLNTKGQMGGAAAAGSVVTGGNRDNMAELAAQLQDQLSSFSRSRQGLDISRQNLGLSQQQEKIGEQQYGLGYQEQQAQLADTQKNYDILSKQFGLNQQDLTNRLNQGLAQLGLSTALSANDVANSIVNAQKGISDSITPILGYLYQAIGIGPIGGPNG